MTKKDARFLGIIDCPNGLDLAAQNDIKRKIKPKSSSRRSPQIDHQMMEAVKMFREKKLLKMRYIVVYCALRDCN